MSDILPELRQPAITYTTEGAMPERTVRQHQRGQITQMMTEIDPGVFVAWDRCASCGAGVQDCGEPGGPAEPAFIARWRQERLDKEARMVKPTPRSAEDSADHSPIKADAQAAADEGIDKALQALRDRKEADADVGF